jgi:hypothetical protein
MRGLAFVEPMVPNGAQTPPKQPKNSRFWLHWHFFSPIALEIFSVWKGIDDNLENNTAT